MARSLCARFGIGTTCPWYFGFYLFILFHFTCSTLGYKQHHAICSTNDMIFINRRFLSICSRHFAFICFLKRKKGEKIMKMVNAVQMTLYEVASCDHMCKQINEWFNHKSSSNYLNFLSLCDWKAAYLHFLCTRCWPTYKGVERILHQTWWRCISLN